MTSIWKEGQLTPEQRRSFAWSIVALVACLVMNAYHYSLEGAKGLYVWNRTGLFRSLILMGFIPGSVALLAFPLEKLKNKIVARACRVISLVLSALVVVASVGILAALVAIPRTGRIDPPRLALINPADGIAPLAQMSEGSFASGQVSPSAPATVAKPAAALPAAEKAQAAAPLLRLSFSSDPHWGAESSNASARTNILASVAEHRPDAFFMLGDTVETGSSAAMWNFALSDLEALIPKVPLRPLLGNHDALFGGQYLFKKAFIPASFKSDSGSPYYYSIDAKAAKIIVLDLPWGTENYGNAQKTWLERTLRAANRAKPIIVLSHSFFYASGYDDPKLHKPWYDHYQNIPAIAPLLEEYGVDLVVSGHNHYQEYLEHNGVRYAVIGAMGGVPDPSPSYISPASKWRAVATFGRLDVDVYPSEVALTYRNDTGEPLHEERFGY